ncbi:MAG: sigma-70 family RNA polymerase sigma factor [Acidobacteriota bacterium]|nr:sigma-70 family RNA polymerase sigma factor [Acidobacteriota bacterium]
MPSSATEITPTKLVQRIQTGDPAAEALLVERFSRPVQLLLARHTRRRADADDLFQETFRLALEKLRAGELRQPEKLPGFLASLARNLAIEIYRKAGRRKTDTGKDTEMASLGQGAGQLGEVLDDEKALLVRRVMAGLRNDRDRQLLYRFYLAEEDKETIAADYDLDSLQFNRVLHRARQRYKEALLEHLGDGARQVLHILWWFLAAPAATRWIFEKAATFGSFASPPGVGG